VSAQPTTDERSAPSPRQNRRLFFAFQLGMPFFDHASSGVSRKAQRLDTPERRGTLLHAVLKASFFLLFSIFALFQIDRFLT
jgi:hypothetical protein